ncbi:MAG TPA: hypothetical protein VIJ25_18520 [Methylococcales bacterium]
MKRTRQDPAEAVYKMLSAMYKPLEARLLSRITPDQVKQYKKFSYMKKIQMLDNYAAKLGL